MLFDAVDAEVGECSHSFAALGDELAAHGDAFM